MVAAPVTKVPAPQLPPAKFEFASLAKAEFSFLSADFSLRLVEEGETRIRYESQLRLVTVDHDPRSFHVVVEVGRWIDVDGKLEPLMLPLLLLLAVESGESQLDRVRTAVDRGQLARELHRLASLMEPLAGQLLRNGDELFDRTSELNDAFSHAYTENILVSQIRARAEAAWRRRDLQTVSLAYTEIERKFDTVSLRGSERGRLKYAIKHAVDAPG